MTRRSLTSSRQHATRGSPGWRRGSVSSALPNVAPCQPSGVRGQSRLGSCLKPSHSRRGLRRRPGNAGKDRARVDVEKQRQMVELFTRMADAAKADPDVAAHVRDALAQSDLLSVFGEGQTLDVVELLDVGGDDALRARLKQMT